MYLDGELVGGFAPADLDKLEKVQLYGCCRRQAAGWLAVARCILLHILRGHALKPESAIIVSSSSRGKSAQLTWAEVQDQANMVMFDLSNRGTLKLVSLLPKLDTREEWVQDVDRIEISPP